MIRDGSLINEDFEGYHITSELGSNAFSPTFLGDNISPTAPHQRVIIKLLSSTPTRDQKKQKEILQKISVLQKLFHPHILPIIAAGIHKDMPYIMTEYLPSGSLYDLLQLRPTGQLTNREEAFLMLTQVGQALQYAHQQQVIHGYLKPQNVLFNIRNEALVTDFHRHALQLSDEAEDTDTPELSLYRAPEQLMGRTSEKSDQYALGCLAYILFTGHKPFMIPSTHTSGIYYKTKSLIAPGRLNAALPLHTEEAILKAMSRDPDQRHDDIAAFLAALKLPPASGNREIRKTIVTLAQIMKDNVSDQPPTTAPEAVKKQQPADRVGQGGPPTFSIFGSLPTDMIGQGKPLTRANSELAHAPGEHPGGKNQTTFKIQQPYGVNNKPFFQRVRKGIASRPRQTFAMIVCLMAIIIVFVTTLIGSNFSPSAKKIDASQSINKTSTVNSPSQIGTPSPVSGVIVPSQKATPQSTAPRPVPTRGPTPTSASGPIQVVLTSFFNNKGIGNRAGRANFDGTGYSYPASQLPLGQQISVQGVPYLFPASGPGIDDNMIVSGQAIPLTQGKYREAYLLASSTWGPVTCTITVRYTDGSTTMTNIMVLDWYSIPAGALNTTFRYHQHDIDDRAVHIYAIPLQLDSTRVANVLLLPSQQSAPYKMGRFHVFALTLLP